MRDWKSFLGIILIFALGCLAGAFVSLAIFHQRNTVFLKSGSVAYEQMLERHLSHDLKLDPDQRKRFHEAFLTNIEERKKIQTQLQPQTRALNDQMSRKIKSILTQDQLQQFLRNVVEFRHHFGAPELSERTLRAGAAPVITTNAAPNEISTNSAPTPNHP